MVLLKPLFTKYSDELLRSTVALVTLKFVGLKLVYKGG